MKIIMNYIKNDMQARQAFLAVQRAIEDNIEEGRNNFKYYHFAYTNNAFTVCKNKDSFTVYYQEDK